MRRVFLVAAALVAMCGVSMLEAQGRPDPAVTMAAQREAMKSLAFLDGTWRGSAWTMLPDGTKHEITQTERVGPFLDGTIRIVEGRGYEADGKVGFNALGIISYDASKKSYSMHSHAMGNKGDFVLEPNENGFTWSIPAGPMTIRYTATIKDGKWREIGERIMPGKDPVKFLEMNLQRIGDSDWPAAGAVTPK
jgi:hypothetical protein